MLCPDAPSGTYALDDECAIHLQRGAMPTTNGDFEQMHTFMRDTVQPSSNPIRPRTRECTFVKLMGYEFGQYNDTFRSDPAEWPAMAQTRPRARAVHRITLRRRPHTGLHANLCDPTAPDTR